MVLFATLVVCKCEMRKQKRNGWNQSAIYLEGTVKCFSSTYNSMAAKQWGKYEEMDWQHESMIHPRIKVLHPTVDIKQTPNTDLADRF